VHSYQNVLPYIARAVSYARKMIMKLAPGHHIEALLEGQLVESLAFLAGQRYDVQPETEQQ
jgi:hypothetical protein